MSGPVPPPHRRPITACACTISSVQAIYRVRCIARRGCAAAAAEFDHDSGGSGRSTRPQQKSTVTIDVLSTLSSNPQRQTAAYRWSRSAVRYGSIYLRRPPIDRRTAAAAPAAAPAPRRRPPHRTTRHPCRLLLRTLFLLLPPVLLLLQPHRVGLPHASQLPSLGVTAPSPPAAAGQFPHPPASARHPQTVPCRTPVGTRATGSLPSQTPNFSANQRCTVTLQCRGLGQAQLWSRL